MSNRIVRIAVDDYMMKNLWETGGASESGNAVTLRISFSHHWDNTGRTAFFTDALGEKTIAVPVLNGTAVLVTEPDGTNAYDINVPAEAMLYPGVATLTIVGVEVAGDKVKRRLTTRAGHLRVLESGVPDKIANAVPMTPSDKDQILAQVTAVEDEISAKMIALDEAESGRVLAEERREEAEANREETFRQSEANRAETFATEEAKRQAAERAREQAERERADENSGIVARASNSANDAKVSAARAARSAEEALASRHAASDSALLSRSWAVGETGIRTGENEDNAKYYAELAAMEAERATVPPVEGVYNLVLQDRADQGKKYAIIAEDGFIKVLPVSPALDATELILLDHHTGIGYEVTVESGLLKVKEV